MKRTEIILKCRYYTTKFKQQRMFQSEINQLIPQNITDDSSGLLLILTGNDDLALLTLNLAIPIPTTNNIINATLFEIFGYEDLEKAPGMFFYKNSLKSVFYRI